VKPKYFFEELQSYALDRVEELIIEFAAKKGEN